MDSIDALREYLRGFARRRDWEQFHTPKNLAMALAGEAGELLAEFQWLTPDESRTVMGDATSAAAVRSEMADVFLYLVRLADVLDVDLLAAAREKSLVNESRFPPTDQGSDPGSEPDPTGTGSGRSARQGRTQGDS
ncbi:MAG: nucleotide pyrophosphohydrolase [Actinocatenispora sp.]